MKQKSLLPVCLITLGLLLSAATLSQAQLSAQVKPPLTPKTAAGRRLGDWQRAYNSGDYDQTRKFMADNYAKAVLDQAPADVRATYVVNSVHTNGKMKIIAIEKSSETEIVALLETQLTELQARLTIKVAAEEPHIISAISLTSNSELDIHLDTGYTIIVMSNYDPPIAQQIINKIRQVIPEG